MRVTVRVSAAEVREAARRLGPVLSGHAPDVAGIGQAFAARVANALLDLIAADFDAKGRGLTGADGVQWPPLAPATARLKAGGVILVETGGLRLSLTPGTDATPSGAPGQVWRVAAGRVEVGTTEKPWQHTGTGTLPARPFWPPDGRVPPGWQEPLRRATADALRLAIAAMIEELRT